MLAVEIDFHEVFKVSATAMALLTADFEFLDANEEFLEAAGHKLDDLIGHNIFEVLPKMPSEPGNPKWTALEAALTSRKREADKLIRYDIEDPAHPGEFQERYWSSIVTPVLGLGGEVEVLELSAREVTAVIAEFRRVQAEDE
jgi:PAS domain S-box-containing protein